MQINFIFNYFQNVEISHRIYEIGLNIPKSDKSIALFMIMRSQKELKIEAGIFEDTLEKYANVESLKTHFDK